MRAAGLLLPVAAAAAGAAAMVAMPAEWLAAAGTWTGSWSAWLGGARIAAIGAAYLWWDALVGRVPGLDPEGAAYLTPRLLSPSGRRPGPAPASRAGNPGAVWVGSPAPARS